MGMDHYIKLQDLGGISGAVLAQDKQNSALKVVIKRLADGTQGMEELGASLRVRHPNIVKFVESFVHDGGLYVVLRYEDGGDLDSLLSRLVCLKKFPTPLTLLMWFVQMLDALCYCHGNNIVHRDVKPSNIFLSADTKTLYLGDFGSAKNLGGAGCVTSTFVGSPMWISPEVLLGTPYSYSSDIWSMGCVFYEMACLRRPFAAPNFARLVQQITSGHIAPLPPIVPAPIRAIITAMFVVDAAERPSAEELRAEARRALEAEQRRSDEGKRAAAAARPAPQQQQRTPPPPPVAMPAATPPPPNPIPTPAPEASEEPMEFVKPEQYQRTPQGTPNRTLLSRAGGEDGGGSNNGATGNSDSASVSNKTPVKMTGSGGPTGGSHRRTPVDLRLSPAAVASPTAAVGASPAVCRTDSFVVSGGDENSGHDVSPPEGNINHHVNNIHHQSAKTEDMDGEYDEAVPDDDDDDNCRGKPVAMFVAITPRGPRRKAKPAAKKPSAKKAGSKTPSPVPSLGAASAQSKPPRRRGAGAASAPDVRTFSPKQPNLRRPPVADAAVAVVATPAHARSPAAAQARGPLRRGTVTASRGREGAASDGSVSVGRHRPAPAASSAAAVPPPPPQQIPRRVLAAAEERRASPALDMRGPVVSPQRPQLVAVKTRPTKAPAVPLPAPQRGEQRLLQRLAAHGPSAPPDSDSDSGASHQRNSNTNSNRWSTGEMRKSQWIRARTDDVSAIDDYLNQFRGQDEEMLHSYDNRRRPSLVGRGGGGVRGRQPQPSAARSRSPDAAAPPPPQQLQRGVVMSSSVVARGKRGGAVPSPDRARRINSSAAHLGSTSHATPNAISGGQHRGGPLRQASNARASKPRSAEEQARLAAERDVARERREAERERMAEMIREQRAQQQGQRKKKRDTFDVEVLMPDR